jgi:HupE / UreJ protein
MKLKSINRKFKMKIPNSVFIFISFIFLLLPQSLSAHGADLNGLPADFVISMYLKLGFEHIIPLGLDHILFVVCLFFLSPKLKTVILQATAFTVAHTITLGLAMYGVISAPNYIVEPIIALSIMFLAIENIISDQLKPTRIVVVFIFGLIHGLGFASDLSELGLPEDKFLLSLLTFNIGVELGQITIILCLWFLIGKWFSKKPWYKKRIVIPVSVLIAGISFYWMIERIFFTS